MGEFLNGILDNIRRKVGAMVGPVLPGAGNSPVDPTNMRSSGSEISEFGTVYGHFLLGDFL
jgi:hypothetical protein